MNQLSATRFRVALSFPGEYRTRVEHIAEILAASLSREEVLYDKWYRAEFARPNLDTYLLKLYLEESQLLVFFLCRAYPDKEWCGLEWRAGRALLKGGEDDRLMFLRLDNADIPGLYSIDGYLDISVISDSEVATAILERLRILDRLSVHGTDSPPNTATDQRTAVLRLMELANFDPKDVVATGLVNIPGVLSDFVKQLLTSRKQLLPSILAGVLSYCLTDRSNLMYKQFKDALTQSDARFEHGNQGPEVHLRDGETIDLLLPLATRVRYMEVRGSDVIGAASVQLRSIVADDVDPSGVQEFLQSLELNAQDQELLAEGCNLEFYWDAADIRDAVLGMAAYYSSGIFEISRFRSDLALVRCLLSAGWLGKIRVLPPHLAEFLHLLRSDFGIGSGSVPVGGVRQFIRDSGVAGSDEARLSSFTNSSHKEIAELVRQQAGNAPVLFKVVHCIAHTSWKARLESWVRSGLWKLGLYEFDYAETANSKDFQRLIASFEQMRPGFPVNNFTDAMALCILARQVRDFSAGSSRRFPLFFESSPIYKRVLNHTGLQNLLESKYRGRTICVLRNATYFKLRAALYVPADLRSGNQSSGFAAYLKEVREKVQEIADIRQSLRGPAFETLIMPGRPLADILRSLQLFWFLDNIWLPYSGSVELTSAIQEHMKVEGMLEGSREFREHIDSEIKEIIKELLAQSQEYRRVAALWQARTHEEGDQM